MQKKITAGDVSALSERLGYTFANEALAVQALTHSSYRSEHHTGSDYERLEFLGDAVLELTCSEYLYAKYPQEPEGWLTKRRAAMVCENALARVATETGLDKLLLLGVGIDRDGGRKLPRILCNVTEAVLGAVYLDGGPDAVRPIISRLVLSHEEELIALSKDAKSQLQELLETRGDARPKYDVVAKEGKDNDPLFTVELSYKGCAVCRASGRSKKAAEQEAARLALEIMKS